MPTNLPVRVAPQSQAADTNETFRAFLLFYLGMALITLLLIVGERHFGLLPEHAMEGSMLSASPAGLFIDESGIILLPAGP